MDLPTTLGAPRHCYLGGQVYWVQPMTLLAMGTVMQWLDDVLPGRTERKMPPKIGDEASQRALCSFPGQVLLTWLALKDNGFSYAQAAELVPHPPDDDDNEKKAVEHLRLLDVFMSRRRTMGKSEGGEDWSETWLDEGMARLATEYGINEIAALTLDQFDWLCSGGNADAGEQYDLQTIQENFYANTLPAIKAAMEAGEVKEYQEERPDVIKMAMDQGIVKEIAPPNA